MPYFSVIFIRNVISPDICCKPESVINGQSRKLNWTKFVWYLYQMQNKMKSGDETFSNLSSVITLLRNDLHVSFPVLLGQNTCVGRVKYHRNLSTSHLRWVSHNLQTLGVRSDHHWPRVQDPQYTNIHTLTHLTENKCLNEWHHSYFISRNKNSFHKTIIPKQIFFLKWLILIC